jgi:hypothetical protein
VAQYVLKDCKLYVDGFDLSGDHNALSVQHTYDEVPCKVFGKAANFSLPGLSKIAFSHEGYMQANGTTGVDDVYSARLGSATDAVITWCPATGAVTERSYFSKGIPFSYEHGGQVGEMYAFTVSGAGRGQILVPGSIMKTGAITANGTSTAYQVGAVGATQSLYAAMHIVAVTGTNPTLDLLVQSDDAEAFASPITRVTFAQAAAIGAQWATPVAGAIADDWWRLSYTIGGTNTPSFTVVVSIGIR